MASLKTDRTALEQIHFYKMLHSRNTILVNRQYFDIVRCAFVFMAKIQKCLLNNTCPKTIFFHMHKNKFYILCIPTVVAHILFDINIINRHEIVF